MGWSVGRKQEGVHAVAVLLKDSLLEGASYLGETSRAQYVSRPKCHVNLRLCYRPIRAKQHPAKDGALAHGIEQSSDKAEGNWYEQRMRGLPQRAGV